MITVSKEDYLKAIFEAESEGESVISATLAGWLKVTPPAVTMALRRLKRDGLVEVRKHGRVRLTDAGRRIAKRTAIRHHLIERMLNEVFEMPWYRTHDEAERLEHAVSADFELVLVRSLAEVAPVLTAISQPSIVRHRRAGVGTVCCLKPNRASAIS